MFGRNLWWYAAIVGAMAALPCTAFASSWVWPVPGTVSQGFGSQWTDPAGRTCAHGGLDIASGAGANVLACTGGRVTFAGRVPAAGGGSTMAVSVITADGLKYTCMPLSELAVAQGQDVDRESVLGSLAGSGDGSSDATHLHLTVRRGNLALDPASLLEVRSASASGAAPETSLPRAEGGGVGASVPGPAHAHAPSTAPAAEARRSSPVSSASALSLPAIETAAGPASGVTALAGRLYPVAPAALSRRIRPLPARVGLDLGATYAAVRAWTHEAWSVVTKLLLAALGALLVAPVLRRLGRASAPGGAALAPATSRRPRR